jgi:hypothetical protein
MKTITITRRIIPLDNVNLKVIKKLSSTPDVVFNNILQNINSNTDPYNKLTLRFYDELNIYRLNNENFISFKLTQQQAAVLCSVCKCNDFKFINLMNFDFNQILRWLKINKIFNNLSFKNG